jgi:hypothetical protein
MLRRQLFSSNQASNIVLLFSLERICDFCVSNLGLLSHVQHASQTDGTPKIKLQLPM